MEIIDELRSFKKIIKSMVHHKIKLKKVSHIDLTTQFCLVFVLFFLIHIYIYNIFVTDKSFIQYYISLSMYILISVLIFSEYGYQPIVYQFIWHAMIFIHLTFNLECFIKYFFKLIEGYTLDYVLEDISNNTIILYIGLALKYFGIDI